MSMRHSARITRTWWVTGVIATALAASATWYGRYRDRPTEWSPPQVVVPVPNGFDTLDAAASSLVDAPRDKPPGADHFAYCALDDLTSFLPEKRAEAEVNRAAFAAARTAIDMPMVVPPPAWNTGRTRRLLERMARCESHSLAADGDWSGAMTIMLDAITLAKRLEVWDPGALSADATRLIQGAAALAGHLDETTARQSARRVERTLTERPQLRDAWLNDKNNRLVGLSRIMEGNPHWRGELLLRGRRQSQSALGVDIETELRDIAAAEFATKKQVLQAWSDYYDLCLPLCSLPIANATERPAMPFTSSARRSNDRFVEVVFLWQRCEAALAQLAVALALVAFRADHGHPPDDLKALVPRYLDALPRDPFSVDEPVRIAPAGTGLGVYSVGPDGLDDGGRSWQSHLSVESTGDYVLGVTK